jgi:hypothetical protein
MNARSMVCHGPSQGAAEGLPRRAIGNRGPILGGVFAYIVIFNWVYVSYLFPVYGYYGFALNAPDAVTLGLVSLLSLAPALWMPRRIRRPSQLIYWIIYTLVYVPSMFVPAYVQLQSPDRIRALAVILFLGQGLIGASYLLPAVRIRVRALSLPMFWLLFGGLTFGLFGYVFFIYRGHFQLVSFQKIYEDVRFSGSAVAEGTLVDYAIMLLGAAIDPLLMAFGLAKKRKMLFAAGAAGQLILYATAGLKAYVLSPFIIVGFWLLLGRKKGAPSILSYLWALTAICAALNCCNLLNLTNGDGGLNMLAAIVFMRILGIPGLNTAYYYDFFSDHPFTLFSHVKGVSQFVAYPYPKDIGHVIGLFYWNNPDLNANAHFWATDGLASCGLPGIILISGLCAILFWVLDSVSAKHGIILSSLVFVYPAMNITNISLFTSLWSGGIGFCILALLLLPVHRARHGRSNASPPGK